MDLLTAYRKERKRILNIMSKLRTAGAKVNYELPKIPKRITWGSVNRLRQVTPEKVRRKSKVTYYDTAKKEVITKTAQQVFKTGKLKEIEKAAKLNKKVKEIKEKGETASAFIKEVKQFAKESSKDKTLGIEQTNYYTNMVMGSFKLDNFISDLYATNRAAFVNPFNALFADLLSKGWQANEIANALEDSGIVEKIQNSNVYDSGQALMVFNAEYAADIEKFLADYDININTANNIQYEEV